MGSTSNPSTDPETCLTTAEVRAFAPMLLSRHTPVCVVRITVLQKLWGGGSPEVF